MESFAFLGLWVIVIFQLSTICGRKCGDRLARISQGGGCDSDHTPRARRITGNNMLLSTVYLIISRKEDELSPWHITMGVIGACGDAWHVRSQESHVWLVVGDHGHGAISVLGQASMGVMVTAY